MAEGVDVAKAAEKKEKIELPDADGQAVSRVFRDGASIDQLNSWFTPAGNSASDAQFVKLLYVNGVRVADMLTSGIDAATVRKAIDNDVSFATGVMAVGMYESKARSDIDVPDPYTAKAAQEREREIVEAVNAARIKVLAGVDVVDLKRAGVPIGVASKVAGKDLKKLHSAGYTSSELLTIEGVSMTTLKETFDASIFRVSLPARTVSLLGAIYDPRDAPKRTFLQSVVQLRTLGYKSDESGDLSSIADAGYSIDELLSAGWTLKDYVDDGANLAELHRAGASLDSIGQATNGDTTKFTTAKFKRFQLVDAGLNDTKIAAVVKDMYADGGGTPIYKLRSMGYTTKDFATSGADAEALRAGGLGDAPVVLSLPYTRQPWPENSWFADPYLKRISV